MNRPLVLLRPQPGNDRSAETARALGLDVVQMPLFEIVGLSDAPVPQGPFDALLLTSANAARFGSDIISRFNTLPLFAVGEATAAAAREAGHSNIVIGGGDVAKTIPLIEGAGHCHILHPCGEETRPFDPGRLDVVKHVAYRSEAVDMRPYAKRLATLPPSVMAVHSPAAGRRLNALLPLAFRNHLLLAISAAAAEAAGRGWRSVHVSPSPDDTALLRLASTLCMGPKPDQQM